MLPHETGRMSARFICHQCTGRNPHLRPSRPFHSPTTQAIPPQSTSSPTSTHSRRAYSQQQQQQQQQPKKKQLPRRASKLTNRRLISVHGQDASGFLQGITTNTIRPEQRTGLYSAFLTAQGRVLNDVFIYPTQYSAAYLDTLPGTVSRSDPGFLIEVDADEASKLFTHIKRFKLRAKVNLKLLDEGEWNVWSIWKDDHLDLSEARDVTEGSPTQANDADNEEEAEMFEGGGAIGCPDRRAPGMGLRVILPRDTTPNSHVHDHQVHRDHDHAQVEELSLEAYTMRRMLQGVPEGQQEIWRETALPQESNLDYMGGIDYRKGCYVGQELTIRTHHTGVVRKRILPCRLYHDWEHEPESLTDHGDGTETETGTGDGEVDGIGDINARRARLIRARGIPPGTDITDLPHLARDPSSSSSPTPRPRKTGKWLRGNGGIGLGLCRLDAMTHTKLPAGALLWKPGMQFGCTWHTEDDPGGMGIVGVKVKAFIPPWFPGSSALEAGRDLRGRSRRTTLVSG